MVRTDAATSGCTEVLIQAGRTLAHAVHGERAVSALVLGPESLFIDIMMNVPLIFYAAKETGDAELLRIAEAHCRTTREYLVRPDGSTAHEGTIRSGNGQVSATDHASRPQRAKLPGPAGWPGRCMATARSMVSPAMAEFLEVAERNADYWLAHLPADKVPYWDFDADLAQPLAVGPQKDTFGRRHRRQRPAGSEPANQVAAQRADRLSPARPWRCSTPWCDPSIWPCDTPGWEGILKHGVYHTRKNLGVDESVMWGEFFFVEALGKALAEVTEVA